MSDEPEGSKQCRICLDGEDPELGRLIRPCLCKGTISVSELPRRRWQIAVIEANHHVYTVCACEVLAKVEKYRGIQERFLCMSTVWIPLPLCAYAHSGRSD